MPESIPTSVLVIDHNPILLQGLSSLIQTEPDMVLAGAASNVHDALMLFARVQVDCVLIDLDTPSAAGIEGISRMRKADPAVTLIGLITYELDDRVSDALASGASAVLGKDQISQSLTELIRKTCGHIK